MLVEEHVEPEQLVAAVAVPRGLMGVGGHVTVRRCHGAEYDVLDRPLHLRQCVCVCARARVCVSRAQKRRGAKIQEA